MPPPTADQVLHDVFGLDAFRPGQREVVEAQLAGRDVLSVAPTGSGKSISYWVPALAAEGLTVVVSPLIALMKDQVDRLRSLRVRAALINSTLSRPDQVETLRVARLGGLQLLYLAPERLSRPGFVERLAEASIRRFVVDEAHCISSWGHDFRPDYLLLGEALGKLGRPPVGAFTATATPEVREDIARNLGLRDPVVSVTGFNRPNLRLEVAPARGAREKLAILRRRLDPAGGRALVYCGTVAGSEELAAAICGWGIPALPYNGRLGDEARRRAQEDFAAGRVKVVVATSAFGMGIDLPDIRQVVHYQAPGSLEAYYQEAGRAGRDGFPATCLLIHSGSDRELHSFFIEKAFPEPVTDPVAAEQKRHAYARLAQVSAYASSRGCRHARIADYFGEEGVARRCEACDNCLAEGRSPGVPVGAEVLRAALAGAARFSGRIGLGNLAAVLGGRDTRWTREHDWVRQLPSFGSLPGWTEDRVRRLFGELLGAGLVGQTPGQYPMVTLTDEGREALAGRAPVEVSMLAEPAPPAGPGDPGLFEQLRRWRAEVARRDGVPAYVVFHDRALAEVAARRPASEAALAAVPGVGPSKLARYGAEVLAVVASSSSSGGGEAHQPS